MNITVAPPTVAIRAAQATSAAIGFDADDGATALMGAELAMLDGTTDAMQHR